MLPHACRSIVSRGNGQEEEQAGRSFFGVGNKVASANDGTAASDNVDAADADHAASQHASRAQKEQDAEDRQLEHEMEQDVVSDDSLG